jgi:hypothetical protein
MTELLRQKREGGERFFTPTLIVRYTQLCFYDVLVHCNDVNLVSCGHIYPRPRTFILRQSQTHNTNRAMTCSLSLLFHFP